MFSDSHGFAAPFAAMLLTSLLVTATVQGVVALLDLRGRNLECAVAKLLGQIDPARFGASVARETARALLLHPAVRGPLGRPAKAISPAELVRLACDAATRRGLLNRRSRTALSCYLLRNTIQADVEAWFSTVMRRASDRFRLQVRMASLASAAAAAWVFPMDPAVFPCASAARFLAQTLLLSLGAPFWFNLLRTLADLKPAAAQAIERDSRL